MQIAVSGKSFAVGDSLKEYVENEIQEKTQKYFENAITADIVLSKEASHLVKCDIIINQGTGNNIFIRSNANADDPYIAFDIALDKVEKQLRRYKRKLKDRSSCLSHVERDEQLQQVATKYVIKEEESLGEANDNPLIIAEKQTNIEILTVSDAVMNMNLNNVPALLFINKLSGNLSVVYHREDGNISWIDTTNIEEIRKAS